MSGVLNQYARFAYALLLGQSFQTHASVVFTGGAKSCHPFVGPFVAEFAKFKKFPERSATPQRIPLNNSRQGSRSFSNDSREKRGARER